jgi:uncharacterized protein (TIGR03083 family)
VGAATSAGQPDVIGPLRAERAAFLDLLDSLEPDEWDLPTECPAWSVKGIALHVLGDDLSLLSRQRDAATNSLELLGREQPELGFRELLDRFNEAWVERASFMSTRLVTELLRLTGELTADFYEEVDPDRLGEAVPFAGPEPATYWMIAAREYAERWIHHLQLARATSRPGPVRADQVTPAVTALVRGFPAAMRSLHASEDAAFSLAVTGTGSAWTLAHDGETWQLHDGEVVQPTVRLEVTPETAARLFSRDLTRQAILDDLPVTGDPTMARAIREGLAAFFARTSAG